MRQQRAHPSRILRARIQPRQRAARANRQIRQCHLYQNLTRAHDPDSDLIERRDAAP